MQSDTTVRISKHDRGRLEDEREDRRESTGEKPTVKQLLSEAIDLLRGEGDDEGGDSTDGENQ